MSLQVLIDQFTVSSLPMITPDLPGIGGLIKTTPEDFVVEEIPLYEPAGEGEHLYLRLTRAGQTTRELLTEIARAASCPESAVGYAGLKDKRAIVTQTFSVPTLIDETVLAERLSSRTAVDLHWIKRHRNKLKPGHLLSNRFTIRVRSPLPTAHDQAKTIAERLSRVGVPNYYHAQRFGRDGTNALQGLAILSRGLSSKDWRSTLKVNALQSALFNQWLALRVEQGYFSTLIAGDLAKKHTTGGLFSVLDLESEQRRADDHEISLTGPIYGSKMRWPTGESKLFEEQLLQRSGIEFPRFSRANGSRRIGRIFPEGMTLTPEENGIRFAFTLPKGSYATSVLREFRKLDD